MNPDRQPDVLVIDDEAQLRRLMRYSLERAGYAVREAENGRIALGEIALQPPDLIILDLGLPDRPGATCSAPSGRCVPLR